MKNQSKYQVKVRQGFEKIKIAKAPEPLNIVWANITGNGYWSV